MTAASPVAPDFSNTNSLWCGVLVETLVRSGVKYCVISPGSRSAPLTFAFARHPGIEAIPLLDERSAGFFALGLAKRDRRPVALVCTSGSAAANFLPAIVEAHESGVPLIVLTADRPPEMRDCRSGQTIDQQKIYGGYVGFAHEFAVPEATLPMLRYLRQTVVHAAARSLQPAGPVHLNCPFRDPLPPIPEKNPLALASEAFAGFFDRIQPATPQESVGGRGTIPGKNVRGVIVVGPSETGDGRDFAAGVGRLSRALGWPVLTDALAPLRSRVKCAGVVVTRYDAILREEKTATALKPEAVICVGGWPTSKVLRAWLQQADPLVTFVTTRVTNEDALHLRTRLVRASVENWSKSLRGGREPSPYAEAWRQAEQRANRVLRAGLEETKNFVEPHWPGVLASHLPAGTPCFISSSMAVRDAEYFWPANNRGHDLFFNRGANGIDGTLSTALGIAHGHPRPAVLVTGDLALLHDTNGFLCVPKLRGSLTILLINNEGGGIFEHLPVAQFDPPFEEFFGTPQKVDFGRLAAAYGVEHVLVPDAQQLAELCRHLPVQGVRVLEMRTQRKRDAAFRKKLFARFKNG